MTTTPEPSAGHDAQCENAQATGLARLAMPCRCRQRAAGPSVSGQPTPQPDNRPESMLRRVDFAIDDEPAFPAAFVRDATREQLAAGNARLRSQLAEARNRAAELDEANARLQVQWESRTRQLTEARMALVSVAKALDGSNPKAEHMPHGYPDLAIGVQQLKHELAEAWDQRNDARAERDSLREERDGLAAEVRRVADEWDAQTDHVDWDAVNVVERFVADLRAVLAATTPPPAAPAEPPVPCLASDRDLSTNRPLRCTREAHSGAIHSWVFADEPEPPAAPVQPEERRDPRPFVSHDPGIRSGEPCLNHTRLPVESVAGYIWAGEGMQSVMDAYDIPRADVLVACWWIGTYGPKKWRKRWGSWALRVHPELWHGRYEFADPPSREEDDVSKSENRQRTKLVGVRLTPEEHEAAAEQAGKRGLSVAEFLRESVAALATAERQREEARVKHLSLADGTDVFIDGDVYTVVDVDFTSPGALVTLAALGSTPDTGSE